jgi:hypothetical protein
MNEDYTVSTACNLYNAADEIVGIMEMYGFTNESDFDPERLRMDIYYVMAKHVMGNVNVVYA